MGPKVSAEALDSVFTGLLHDFPGALVVAMDPDGGFVAVPDSVPLDEHDLVADGSLLSMVVPADRVVVSDAWDRLEGQGFMICDVHLVGDPDRPVRVHLTDMRHRYGVLLGVLVRDGENMAEGEAEPLDKPAAMLVTDEAAVYTRVDESVTALLGWAPSEMIGRRALEFIHPDDQDPAVEGWIQLLSSGQSLPVRFRHQRRDGTWLWVEFRNNLFRGETGAGYVICEMLDVSSEMSDPDPAAARGIRPRLAMVHKDELAVIIGVDQAATQMLGWTAPELIGKRSLDLIHPDDHARAIATWARILTTRTRQRVRLRHRCGDGSWIWVEITNHLIEGEPGQSQVVAEMLDVSEEMAAQEALRRRERLFRRLTESLPAGLFQIDREGRVVYANARLQEILGASPAETAMEQLAAVHEDDQDRTGAAVTAVLAGADEDLEVRVRPPGRRNVLLLCTLTLRSLPEEDGAVSGALIMVTDVTESARLRAELEVRATYDALTNCYNRASIMAILEGELARSDGLVGTVFIDLDGFKQVNDRHGHAAGDELLVLVAERLRASVRSGDLVARIGGDEFLVVSPNVSGPQEALRVAERLRQALEVEAELSAGRVLPRASIGVAWANSATITAHGLVALADTAMYESKRLGTGRPVAIDSLQVPAPNPS